MTEDIPSLDIGKLRAVNAAQQGLHLLTSVIELEKWTVEQGEESLILHNAAIRKAVFEIIELEAPAPSRAIRNSLGRILQHLFHAGDGRGGLFECIQQLVEIVNRGKAENCGPARHAAAYLLGEVYQSVGRQAIGLSGLVCTSLLKYAKLVLADTGARASVFRAVGHITATIGNALEDTTLRDLWKAARKAAIDDKMTLVQVRAIQCLRSLLENTQKFGTTTSFDEIRTIAWKVIEGPSKSARDAAISCLTSCLVKAFCEKAVAKTRTKKVKTAVDGEASLTRSESSTDLPKSSVKLELALSDILLNLTSRFIVPATSNKGRIALADCITRVIQRLDPSVGRSRYLEIFTILTTEILHNPFINHDRRRQILARRLLCRIMDRGIAVPLLTESARVEAAQALITSVLKEAPSKYVLVCALQVLAALIESLGSAFESVAGPCGEALLQLTSHLSYSVQVSTAFCFQRLVEACPQHLLSCSTKTLEALEQETSALDQQSSSPRRSVGLANCTAAIVSASARAPLFSSLGLNSRLLSTASNLLRKSSEAGLRAAGAQVQVAWILLGALTSLGPEFVKIHLSQFMLLWRNALTPMSKDQFVDRQFFELCYLTCIREYALGCLLTFLRCNQRLLTSDVGQRISKLLQNSSDFVALLPTKRIASDSTQKLPSSLKIQDLVLMVRRRIFQCHSVLASTNACADNMLAPDLFLDAVMTFAEPETGPLALSIQNSSSSHENLINAGDPVCSWTTSMLSDEVRLLDFEDDMKEICICRKAKKTLGGAPEHDFAHLFDRRRLPDSPSVELINSSITLFAISFPLQTPAVQSSTIAQLASILSSPSRDAWRRIAISTNIIVALYQCLRVFNHETKLRRSVAKAPAVDKAIAEILRTACGSDDCALQRTAAAALGKLCNSAGNTFTSGEVDTLINTIVENREPNVRAGCALALGAIHTEVGGMAAGLHMKKIHGVLLSLSNDPQPHVHHCAILALSQLADSAGLAFAGLILSTTGLLAQLWASDNHNEECCSAVVSNAEVDRPTSVAIARCTASLIDVLGPDLQTMPKMQDLVLKLSRHFDVDEAEEVQIASLRIRQSLHLYCPALLKTEDFVRRLMGLNQLEDRPLQLAVLDCLHDLVYQDAALVMQVGGKALEEQLWLNLNFPPFRTSVHLIVRKWRDQTAIASLPEWLSRCQQLLTRTSGETSENAPTVIEHQDEEVAGFNVNNSASQTDGKDGAQELLSWQVRFIALETLNELVTLVHRDGDADAAKVLQQRVADVIRLAFLASTASVLELQIAGLRLIDQVLQYDLLEGYADQIYGTTPDPDFAEALLLEQYQAQISSALTPAFAPDSSPDLASAAVNVCATFISAGLVTDVDRMGRILRLLITVLGNCDAGPSTANAQTKVRLAVLSAWAKLQIHSSSQPHLAKVVEPQLARLTPLWLASLREFARLKFEPDISDAVGLSRPEEELHVRYAAYNRCTLLQFYQDAWLQIIGAVASLLDDGSTFIFDPSHHNDSFRREPATFFYILFGLVIESLIRARDEATLLPQKLAVLKTILKPAVAGTAVFQEVIFSETIDLLQRLALTSGPDVHVEIVEIIKNLCQTHPSAHPNADSDLSDDVEQLFELSRILVLILTPALKADLSRDTRGIQACVAALVEISTLFPPLIQDDLHACVLHIFSAILSSPTAQSTLVPLLLPILREFLQREKPAALVCLFLGQMLCVLSVSQRRELPTSIMCAKNILLACTITLSTSVSAVESRPEVLLDVVDAIVDCLCDSALAKVAANCVLSLSKVLPANLLPRVLVSLQQCADHEVEMLLLQAITTMAHANAGISLAASMILSRAKRGTPQDYRPRLMELAGDTAAFRATVGRMTAPQRALTEDILRTGRVEPVELVQQPSIALRTFGIRDASCP